MANPLGDYDLSTIVYGKFVSCRADTGAPATLTSGALSVYKDNSTTQSTTGVTFTGDFDSVTGLNHFAIDTSADGTFYAAGSFFDIVVTTGTVNSVSAVGSCVGQFTIRKTSGVKPTTAGRTLDVSAGGEAGVDWANVGSPTTSLALTGTTIAVTQKVDVDTIKTNPVVNGGTTTFPTNATLASTTNITAGTVTTATNVTTVNGLAANVITATSINADAITAAKIADGAIDAATFAASAITATVIAADAITAAKIADGAIDAATFAAGAITAAAIADGAIDRATFAADTGMQPIRSNTATAGSGTTITLDASASAVDSFYINDIILLTGGAGVGQARFISAYVGATKVATVATWATNPDNTTTFAILPFDAVAGASAPTVAQIATGVWQDTTAGDFTTAGSIGKSLFTSGAVPGAAGGHFIAGTNAATTVAITGNITGNLSGSVGSVTGAVGSVTGAVGSVTGLTASDVGAIKAKTDNLPAAPAAVSDIPTANANADALLDRADAIETGVTPRKAMRLQSAVLGAKLSGAGTGTEVFRNAVADAKDRVTATVDPSGNRTAITYDLT